MYAANGQRASASTTLSQVTQNTEYSDKILLHYTPPVGQEAAEILGFRYTSKSAYAEDFGTGAPGSHSRGIYGLEIYFLDASKTARTVNETDHEIDTTPTDWTLEAEYGSTEHPPVNVDYQFPIGDVSSGFGTYRVSGVEHTAIASFDDFSGVSLRVLHVNNNSYTYQGRIYLDTFELQVLYVPVPDGTPISLTVGTITQSDASTVGIALDGSWGSEVAFDNPTRAAAYDTSYALATTNDVDTESQTKFMMLPFAANQLTAALTKRPKELRVTVMSLYAGNASANTTHFPADYAEVGEFALIKSDGTVLLKASDGYDLYDHLTYQIPSASPYPYGTFGHYRAERNRTAVLDISSLTAAQIADLNTNGFSFAIRWNLKAYSAGDDPVHGSPYPGNFYVQAITAAKFVYDDLDGVSITASSTLVDTQTSNGLIGTTTTGVAYVYISDIQHGTLYKHDGTTVVSSGSFVSKSEWETGLKFTPSTGFRGLASFKAQGATLNDTGYLSGPISTGKILVWDGVIFSSMNLSSDIVRRPF